ncbi:TetR/AcrR family transcriptional regulator [Lactobacillaceae bacterium Melli_B4]
MTKYEHKRQSTQNKIINSTFKLGQQFGLTNITISSIIREADINRSTFYRYFIDKQQLIDFIQDNILQQIKTEFKKYNQLSKSIEGTSEYQTQFLESFLSVIDNYHQEISFLISAQGSSSFNYDLANLFVDLTEQRLPSVFGVINKKNKPIYAYYFGSSIIGIIKFWIDHYEAYTKKDIINFIMDLNSRISFKR